MVRFAGSLVLLVFACGSFAVADENATIPGSVKPSVSERAFVDAMQADLTKRFPKAADAVRAGYVRYTNPDSTGAISYANMRWQSAGVGQPSQLWYDTAGNLLGADYSRLATSMNRPKLWGIAPGRWEEFDDHIHYVKRNPATGELTYDNYISIQDFAKGGGDPAHPTAATLVKLHKVASVADVATVFDFPKVWDLIVWVKPNPDGAFAEKNPTVTSKS